ncbi:hypothetical protein BGW80DRAFT_911372 [Lactifluus volemus]|nr:hypothetical protein BGW80DRAFT_911372 [Lactifluus volemus]
MSSRCALASVHWTYAHTFKVLYRNTWRSAHLQFASTFSRDARTLALADAVLILSTGICVSFAKAVGWGGPGTIGQVLSSTMCFRHSSSSPQLRGLNRQWHFLDSHTSCIFDCFGSYSALIPPNLSGHDHEMHSHMERMIPYTMSLRRS